MEVFEHFQRCFLCCTINCLKLFEMFEDSASVTHPRVGTLH